MTAPQEPDPRSPEGRYRDIAAMLVAARRGGPRPAEAELTDRLRHAEDSYAVQRLVAAELGPVGGFKVAHKPPQPDIMAPLLRSGVRTSPARFDAGELDLIGVELEVGFLVTAPLPDPAHADFAGMARDRLAAVAALEIVDSRLADFAAAGPLSKLADNQSNAGVVIGAPRADWHDLDLETVTARLELGGDTVLDGPARVPGGDAFSVFCRLARMIGDHCGGLQPGQVVITGSLNGLPFIDPGTPVRGRIEGLGTVAVDFPASG